MAQAQPPRWWEIRPAQNLKPASYRCPICQGKLPALSDHMLLRPEGQPAGRRHAHTACVLAARQRGELPTRDEYRSAQRSDKPSLWARLRGRPQ